jgi:hypothetical protein
LQMHLKQAVIVGAIEHTGASNDDSRN